MTEEVCVYQYGYSLPADVTQTHTECRLWYTMLCNMLCNMLYTLLYTVLFTIMRTMLYTLVSNMLYAVYSLCYTLCFDLCCDLHYTQLCILTFCTQLYTLKQ